MFLHCLGSSILQSFCRDRRPRDRTSTVTAKSEKCNPHLAENIHLYFLNLRCSCTQTLCLDRALQCRGAKSSQQLHPGQPSSHQMCSGEEAGALVALNKMLYCKESPAFHDAVPVQGSICCSCQSSRLSPWNDRMAGLEGMLCPAACHPYLGLLRSHPALAMSTPRNGAPTHLQAACASASPPCG